MFFVCICVVLNKESMASYSHLKSTIQQTDPEIGPLAGRSLDCWSSSESSFNMLNAACGGK